MLTLIKSLQDLFFPPLCCCCEMEFIDNGQVICDTCSILLIPLEHENRCRLCYSKLPLLSHKYCVKCMHSGHPCVEVAAVFSYQKPASQLIHKLKYGKHTYLAEALGAYLAVKCMELNWPAFDMIVPVPISSVHQLARGFNQCELMVAAMSQILRIPIAKVLGRYAGEFSQAGLNSVQRQALGKSHHILLDKNRVKGKSILIVDDVLTSGKTLKICAEVIQEAQPKDVYALALCKTDSG